MISSFSFCLGAMLISCFAPISLSNNFTDENPIKLVSDSVRDTEGAVLPVMDDILKVEDISFARLFSSPLEAIYQLGDSISDTGNSIRVDPLSNCANFPYGETYFHNSTGRCSDGLLMIDYFAKFLNLPLLDAYLNKDGNFTHGVNFAVGGAAALSSSILAAKYNVSTTNNLSLDVQLGWLKSHLNSICSKSSECRRKIAESLFFMGEIGGNDYNFAFSEEKTLSDVYQMVPDVVKAIKSATEEIIDLGATQIIVPGNFPIGCLSFYLAIFKTNDSTMYDELQCLKHLNSFAKFHNDQLQQAIQRLQKVYPNVTILYMDYYTALREILQHASSLGFDKNALYKACCGDGDNDYNFGNDRICGRDDVPVCQNPQGHVSWDGIHLTQHAYHLMAKWLIMHTFSGI